MSRTTACSVTAEMLTVPGQAACSCEQEIVTGGKEMDRMSGGDPFRDGARDQGVRRQRKVGTVLFGSLDGSTATSRATPAPRSRTSSVVSVGNRPDTAERVPEPLMFHGLSTLLSTLLRNQIMTDNFGVLAGPHASQVSNEL